MSAKINLEHLEQIPPSVRSETSWNSASLGGVSTDMFPLSSDAAYSEQATDLSMASGDIEFTVNSSLSFTGTVADQVYDVDTQNTDLILPPVHRRLPITGLRSGSGIYLYHVSVITVQQTQLQTGRMMLIN